MQSLVDAARAAESILGSMLDSSAPSNWGCVNEVVHHLRLELKREDQPVPEEYIELIHNDPIISRCHRSGMSLEQTLVVITALKDQAAAEMMKMSFLCPRKIRLADGTIVIWRCPEKLIPDPL